MTNNDVERTYAKYLTNEMATNKWKLLLFL